MPRDGWTGKYLGAGWVGGPYRPPAASPPPLVFQDHGYPGGSSGGGESTKKHLEASIGKHSPFSTHVAPETALGTQGAAAV